MKNKISQNTNRQNLLQLIWLRFVAMLAQIIVIIFTTKFLKITLPTTSMSGVILALLALNLFGIYRLKSHQIISNYSLFFELVADVFALALQLYFSGGISNPFISLFLLQVIIAATLLRPIFAWMIFVITTFCYIWLSFNYVELAFDEESFFDMHLHGMLISYVAAAILLLIFITRIAENLRQRDQKLAKQQQFLRSAMLATAAAHDLGTPLTTISVLLNDWKNPNFKISEPDFLKDISTMEKQLERCKKAVSDILTNAGKSRLEEAKK